MFLRQTTYSLMHDFMQLTLLCKTLGVASSCVRFFDDSASNVHVRSERKPLHFSVSHPWLCSSLHRRAHS